MKGRGVGFLGGGGVTAPLVGTLVVALGLLAMLASDLMTPGPPSTGRPRVARRRTLGEGLVLSGRLVEGEDGPPVAGATVVILHASETRPDGPPPAWAGASTEQTDADGRFTLLLPPDEVADPHATLTLSRVDHRGQVIRPDRPTPLRRLLQDARARAMPPDLGTIPLTAGPS